MKWLVPIFLIYKKKDAGKYRRIFPVKIDRICDPKSGSRIIITKTVHFGQFSSQKMILYCAKLNSILTVFSERLAITVGHFAHNLSSGRTL